MKRILSILTGTVVCTSLMVGVASAGSYNGCGHLSYDHSKVTCVDNSQSSTVTCINNVDVINANGQSSSSGNASVTDNNQGGYAISGTAVNTNNTNTTIDVSCAPVTTTTTPVTPPTGGQGGGTVLGSSTQAPATSLPNTGPSPVSKVLVASVALVAGGLAILSGFLPATYRKMFSK